MARLFTATTPDYYQNTSGVPVAGYPLTIASWFRVASYPTTEITIGGIYDTAANNHFQLISRNNNTVRARARTPATATAAESSNTTTVGVWHHACGVYTSATLRACFVDGGGKATNTTSVTPASLDASGIGSAPDGTSGPMDGEIADFAIWDVALSDAEVAALAGGASPIVIRPANIVFFAPLFGQYSTEPDYSVSSLHLTATGAPAVSPHPPVLNQFGEPVFGHAVAIVAPGAGPSGGDIHYYRSNQSGIWLPGFPLAGLEALRWRKNRLRRR